MESDSILPAILPFPAPGQAPFQLEASREGVRLRLEQAFSGNRIEVRELQMEIRRTPRSLDLSAGPRSLRSVLAVLEGLEVWVHLSGVRWRGSQGVEVESVHPLEGGRRLWVGGRLHGVPFTLRVRVLASSDPGTDVELRVEDPRVFGWVGISWHHLVRMLLEDVRLPWARWVPGDGRVRVTVLSPLLQGLLAERGWKVPDRRGVRLIGFRQEGSSTWVVQFGRPDGDLEGHAEANEVHREGSGTWSEEDLRDHLRDHLPLDGDLLVQGLDHPRLWPEVLGRCREIGEDRPDRVDASLVALLLADRRPDLVAPEDRFRWIRRLVAGMLGEEGGIRDMRWAAGWIGEATRRLPPDSAWAILEEILSLGVAEPDLIRVASVCLERMGRGRQAEALRGRMIALTAAGEVEGLVERTLSALDEEGLSGIADDWLERLVDGPGESGIPDPAVRRGLRKMRALRRTVRDPRGGLAIWWSLLEEDPFDPEVRDLVRMAVQDDSQAHEVATRIAEMAEGRPERRDLLRYAASLVEHRPGLRGRAARWYEESLPGDPDPDPVLDALDRLYRLLGRQSERGALLDRRIAADPDSPRSIGWRLERARDALDAQEDVVAARLLQEVLDREPTNREALQLVREVYRRTGNLVALREVEEVLRDLGDPGDGPGSLSADPVDRWVRVLEQRGDSEEAIPELVRLAAEAVERPHEALRFQEALERAIPAIRRRWGPSAVADLEELAAWIQETRSRIPREPDPSGR